MLPRKTLHTNTYTTHSCSTQELSVTIVILVSSIVVVINNRNSLIRHTLNLYLTINTVATKLTLFRLF